MIREGSIVACDSVDMLAKTSAKRVTLRGTVRREKLPAVREWTEMDGTVSFLYSGGMNELIRALAEEEIKDLTVSEPDLEEIFLHFYGKGGEQA